MKINNLILFCIFICISLISYTFFTYQTTNDFNNEQTTLVAGIAAGYAPFVSINEQGDYEGFDIDIIEQVAQIMDRRLILKDLGSMTSLLMALEQGSIDLIIWGMSITKQRLEKLAMVHYQGANTISYPLIFWKEIPAGINSIQDMNNMIVCVEPSSAQDLVLQKYPTIKILPTEKVDDALLNIQYGKAVGALVEPAIAKKFKNKFPEIQTLDVTLDGQDQVQGCGIVIKKNNIDLINRIETAIAELKQNGVITQAESQWGLNDE